MALVAPPAVPPAGGAEAREGVFERQPGGAAEHVGLVQVRVRADDAHGPADGPAHGGGVLVVELGGRVRKRVGRERRRGDLRDAVQEAPEQRLG